MLISSDQTDQLIKTPLLLPKSVPPAMEETVEESVSRREGERLELLCPLKKDTLAAAEATRSMDEFRVVWTKDGRPLKPELNPNIEVGRDRGVESPILMD